MQSAFESYFRSLTGKTVAVLGLGVSNRPLVRLLLQFGCRVIGCDRTPREKLDPEVLALEQADFRQVLNGFLRKLTRQSRTYFIRRYWYGESIREIADSCGAGEEKVKSSLFRTRQRLRAALEKEGML